MDTALVTQALARLSESGSSGGSREFNAFGSGEAFTAKPPQELLMICLDTSKSMDESAKFVSRINLELSNLASDEADSEEDYDDDDEAFDLPLGEGSWSKEQAVGFSPL